MMVKECKFYLIVAKECKGHAISKQKIVIILTITIFFSLMITTPSKLFTNQTRILSFSRRSRFSVVSCSSHTYKIYNSLI